MKLKAKKVLAFLLSTVMMATLLLPAQADDLESAPAPATSVETITLPVSERVELFSDAEGDSQWQIKVNDDLWVDITGENEPTLQLSYSMVANRLVDGAAEVRCKTSNGDQVSYGSEYEVQVDFDAVPEFEPVQQPDPSTLVVSEAAVEGAASDPASDSTSEVSPQEITESIATPENAASDDAASDNVTSENTVNAPAKASRMMTFSLQAAFNAGEDDVKPKHTITITYKLEDGTPVAQPWVGEFAEDSPIYETIKSPEVLGYAPAEGQESITLNYADGIREEVIVEVTYYPALVNYTIEYYEQNIEDDEYTLARTEAKQGYTGDIVGADLAEEKAGFYALLYDAETPIAADGSTVVEIYYDRLYYLMTFDLAEHGYGVEPIYARYGAPISVGTPTRPGYTFLGWTLNGQDQNIPETMPAEDRTYTAKWQAAETTTVTVVFLGENANDEDYSYLGSTEIQWTPGTQISEEDFNNFEGFDQYLICGKEAHSHGESCVQCTHTHTLDCYTVDSYNFTETTKPNENLTDAGHGIYTYTTQEWWGPFPYNETHYYLELNGTWYCGQNGDTSVIRYNCPHQQQHDESCYACGKEEHTHDASCYLSSILDEKLWTLNLDKNQTVTVQPDGSSILDVYLDRTTFTLSFGTKKIDGGWSGDDKPADPDFYGIITAKWGASIAQQFQAMSEKAGSALWSEEENGLNPWTSYLDIMPTENRTYYNYGTDSGWDQTAYYYGEKLDGTGYDLMYTVTAKYSNSLTVSEEDMFEFEGFTIDKNRSTQIGQSFNDAKFYYTRNSYKLNFYNESAQLGEEYSKTLKFEQSFSSVDGLVDFVPPYPDTLEPGAYQFGGWYGSPTFDEETYVDLSVEKMPATDVLLYAKWVPITHHVSFYLDNTMEDSVSDPVAVPHGEMLPSNSAPIEEMLKAENEGQYESYDFVGWFYIQDGEEHAFDPDHMPVTHDMELYAKWSSNVLKEYTIHYVYKDENGTPIPIADDTTGSALAGTTKTFDAKAGNELYADYQIGYFPLTPSHSLTIDLENLDSNVYTFEYIKKPEVWYTVQYVQVHEDGNETVYSSKELSSTDAIVTENYLYIDGGWMPDDYQKRLVLQPSEKETADEAKQEELSNNVITFYYHKDNEHAPVHVVHMLQNIEGEDYTPYDEETYLDQEIGTTFSTAILTNIEGATFDRATANSGHTEVTVNNSTVSATLGEEGLELILYYNRNFYPYEFRFVDQDTGEEIADSVSGSARYGTQVTQGALEIDGYALVTGKPDSMAIVIKVEDGETAVRNVATFYYIKSTASLTITKTVSGDSSYNGAPFLFHISGSDVDMDVLVPGNGSVTIDGLQVGNTYTVTEDESWAWRYAVSGEREVTIEPNGSNIAFTNTVDNNKWFDHTTSVENQWSDTGVSNGRENQ